VRSLSIWGALAAVVTIALLGVLYETLKINSRDRRSSNTPVSITRSSGFTIKGEALFVNSPQSKQQKFLKSSVWASGPMFANEVIMFEGYSTLILSDGTKRVFGPITRTFKERLESLLPIESTPPGSIIEFQGSVRLFRRETIKVERQMQPDGSLMLYLNTGTVVFRKIRRSNPPQMEVICSNLQSVHDHGMELLAQDKKTVSGRLLLSNGRQVIERETTPYSGTTDKLEPVFIWQLIPKRNEPVKLRLEVPPMK
jgi:hypothetical protein